MSALKTWNHTRFIKNVLSIQCRSSILQFQASRNFSQHREGSSQVKATWTSWINHFEVYSTGECKHLVLAPVCYGKKNINGGLEEQRKKLSQSYKWSLDKRNSYNRSYARSSDCHARSSDTQRAICIWKLSNGTSGGASNLASHEDLEHFEEAHHWNIQPKFYSVNSPT